eukprot:gnl/MRDRNA2_/MRDRNA2_130637_c0_seq1.p1 gnl/MRDRNA2_/MRDRNA2_130637_c0~~gnl/MRDRNA2_/MRDRNA2_130637_c0_seq1.p1  ORF type:complete len:208 (-),score=21.10 gnl/MRDRNA2_/MRDRNA2_130637_c0_seq1:275-898(-)
MPSPRSCQNVRVRCQPSIDVSVCADSSDEVFTSDSTKSWADVELSSEASEWGEVCEPPTSEWLVLQKATDCDLHPGKMWKLTSSTIPPDGHAARKTRIASRRMRRQKQQVHKHKGTLVGSSSSNEQQNRAPSCPDFTGELESTKLGNATPLFNPNCLGLPDWPCSGSDRSMWCSRCNRMAPLVKPNSQGLLDGHAQYKTCLLRLKLL